MALKIDLIGSQATLGVASVTRDRARRRFVIDGTGSTANAADVAADVMALVPTAHPSSAYSSIFGPLPAAEITCGRIGPDKHAGYIDYRRFRASSSSDLVARKRIRSRGLRVYRARDDGAGNPTFDSDGFPSGDLLTKDGSDDNIEFPPREDIMVVSIMRVVVPFRLDTDPTATVFSRVGKINNAAVAWGGFTFGTGQLLFEGLDVDDVQSVNGTEYVGHYSFAAQTVPWKVQRYAFDLITSDKWDTRNEYEYPLASFTSPAFPI